MRDLAEVGVLAALVFVATYFLKIGPIATPAGPTMLKTGKCGVCSKVCTAGAIDYTQKDEHITPSITGMIKHGLARMTLITGVMF